MVCKIWLAQMWGLPTSVRHLEDTDLALRERGRRRKCGENPLLAVPLVIISAGPCYIGRERAEPASLRGVVSRMTTGVKSDSGGGVEA